MTAKVTDDQAVHNYDDETDNVCSSQAEVGTNTKWTTNREDAFRRCLYAVENMYQSCYNSHKDPRAPPRARSCWYVHSSRLSTHEYLLTVLRTILSS